MKRNLFVPALVLLSAGFLFAGGQEEGSDDLSGAIQIAGSSTVYPITVAVAEEFSRIHPNVEIAVQSTGTGGGFKNFFIPGATQINDASRRIKDSEQESAVANGITPIEFQVATDAITIVINPENTWAGEMTVEQLAHIWRPDSPAVTWSDVDPSWPNETIELYGPTAASGTFDYFTDVIVGEEGASRNDFQKTEQDNTIVQAVNGSKYALGYFGMAYYLENQNSVSAVAVNGVLPSLQTAADGSYTPLSRPIFIYVGQEYLQERPELREFVEFYIGLVDTEIISEVGYVPLNPQQKAAVDTVLADALGE